jgi:serine/threonine protein kinase
MLKLIDFGSALRYENETPKERRCTGTVKSILIQIHYLAPEVIKKFYNNKCDIWSLGILLFVLLSGNGPFTAKDHQEIIDNILTKPLTFANPIWKTRPEGAKALLVKML